MELEKKDGQPPVDPSLKPGQPKGSDIDLSTEVEVKVGDEVKNISIEELQKGYMRQADYTKKTTALSEDKKKLADPKLEEARKVLEEMGFAKTDDLKDLVSFRDRVLSQEQKEAETKVFNEFADRFVTLTDPQKVILQDLKKVYPDKTYDDILKTSGFLDQSLIEKSKTSRPVGGATLGMSEEEKKASVSSAVMKKAGIKPASEIADIRSKFNL